MWILVDQLVFGKSPGGAMWVEVDYCSAYLVADERALGAV